MLLYWALAGLIGGAVADVVASRALGRPGIDRREIAAVAIVSAGLVAVVRVAHPDTDLAVLYGLATLVLVALTITDLRARLIPNVITYPAVGVGLVVSALPGLGFPPPSDGWTLAGLPGALVGGLIAGALGLGLWGLGVLMYRRDDVFGLGDVKLAALIGVLCGFPRAITALVAGVMVGGVLGFVLLLRWRSSRVTMPYGPALTIGAYLTILLGMP